MDLTAIVAAATAAQAHECLYGGIPDDEERWGARVSFHHARSLLNDRKGRFLIARVASRAAASAILIRPRRSCSSRYSIGSEQSNLVGALGSCAFQRIVSTDFRRSWAVFRGIVSNDFRGSWAPAGRFGRQLNRARYFSFNQWGSLTPTRLSMRRIREVLRLMSIGVHAETHSNPRCSRNS